MIVFEILISGVFHLRIPPLIRNRGSIRGGILIIGGILIFSHQMIDSIRIVQVSIRMADVVDFHFEHLRYALCSVFYAGFFWFGQQRALVLERFVSRILSCQYLQTLLNHRFWCGLRNTINMGDASISLLTTIRLQNND